MGTSECTDMNLDSTVYYITMLFSIIPSHIWGYQYNVVIWHVRLPNLGNAFSIF